MLLLLWAIINLALLIVFLGLCFRATSLIREKFGLFASIVFVIGLLSFASGPDKDKNDGQHSFQQEKSGEHAQEANAQLHQARLTQINLEETLISNYELVIGYRREDGNLVPVSWFSSTTGFTSGTYWKPIQVSVSASPDNSKLIYKVYGTVTWKLLGISVYSQAKEYNGEIPVK